MMKRQVEIVMFLPPVLLLLLAGTAQLWPASPWPFRSFSVLWIGTAVACILRGFWILKSQRWRGWICIAMGFIYLLFWGITQPATT